MAPLLQISLDRVSRLSLVDQIRAGISAAIQEGRLRPGARLPSWGDLAAQLGVARGTVRGAYERLVDMQLVVAAGPAGTHVADHPPVPAPGRDGAPSGAADHTLEAVRPPGVFQMGVPAQDAFPFKTWSRIMARAARETAAAPVSYPDPLGEPELRQAIAAYLAIARGLACAPSQVIVTAGYAGGLDLTIRALNLHGTAAWMEEPGYPRTRAALALAGVRAVPVKVDLEGLVVAEGVEMAPDAALAIVTPGQQAPLGVTLSLSRRRALLEWAARAGAWIIEDDYLSELQLRGRAAPALASLDRGGRVIHIGSFSKTISPALRLGFVVTPPLLTARFAEVAAVFAPAPAATAQHAAATFLRDGHYLRHLRRMKRLYVARRDALVASLAAAGETGSVSGLAVLLRLPDGAPDRAVADRALASGLAPNPLSGWYARPGARDAGLLLGVTNLPDQPLAGCCERLITLIRKPA